MKHTIRLNYGRVAFYDPLTKIYLHFPDNVQVEFDDTGLDLTNILNGIRFGSLIDVTGNLIAMIEGRQVQGNGELQEDKADKSTSESSVDEVLQEDVQTNTIDNQETDVKEEKVNDNMTLTEEEEEVVTVEQPKKKRKK